MSINTSEALHPGQAGHQPHSYAAAPFPPLETVTRPAVDTAAAAYYLNRRPQTLRVWACREDGPIRPLRVNGRLAWRVADIKAVMGIGSLGVIEPCPMFTNIDATPVEGQS